MAQPDASAGVGVLGVAAEASSSRTLAVVDGTGGARPDRPIRHHCVDVVSADAGRPFPATLAQRQQVLGDDHPDTRTSRSNLANAGRAAQAVQSKEVQQPQRPQSPLSSCLRPIDPAHETSITPSR